MNIKKYIWWYNDIKTDKKDIVGIAMAYLGVIVMTCSMIVDNTRFLGLCIFAGATLNAMWILWGNENEYK